MTSKLETDDSLEPMPLSEVRGIASYALQDSSGVQKVTPLIGGRLYVRSHAGDEFIVTVQRVNLPEGEMVR